MQIRLALGFVFYFIGTCLHELTHYVAALLLGKAEGFSVIPRTEGNRFIFGSVRSRVRYKFLSSLIAAAPLAWWAILLLILLYLRIIRLRNGIPIIGYELIAKKLRSFSFSDAFSLWVFMQMVWAGRLSVQDINNVFKGIFSVSGLVFLSVVIVLFYLCRRFILNF